MAVSLSELQRMVSAYRQGNHLRAGEQNVAVANAAQVIARMNQQQTELPTPADAVQYAEIERIISMPVTGHMTPEEVEAYSRDNVLASAYRGDDGSVHTVYRFNDRLKRWEVETDENGKRIIRPGFRLFPEQAQVVADYEITGGAFSNQAVGRGKTLTCLMVADKAYRKGIDKIVLCIPPQVLDQLIQTDIRWARTKVPISYPIHVLGGKSSKQRMAIARSGKKGLYVIPYSLLSVRDTDEMLWSIAPGLLLLDEGHNVARRSSSARAKRLFGEHGYITKNPATEVVVLSGTITGKSVMDYWHLIKYALKEHNPLPNSAYLANEWGSIIDAQAAGDAAVSTSCAGPMLPLVRWARQWFPEEELDESVAGFRRAYKCRLNSTVGVVSSGDNELGTSLILKNTPVEGYEESAGWEELARLMDQVEIAYLTPNGDQIDHAIHTWKWLNELTAGFYNELTWPTPEQYAHRKGISLSEAEELLAKAQVHHAEGQEYHKMLRRFLAGEYPQKPQSGLDTPMLVGSDMLRNKDKNVPPDMYEQWRIWQSLDFEGRPNRDRRAVRVCDYKIRAAVEWAKAQDGHGCLIWVHHKEVGQWICEMLESEGLGDRTLHCPAGETGNRNILDPNNADKIVVASISAHGTGKNLQHFSRQLFVQWPRDARQAEQTIGRTHRSGQKADELIVNLCLTTSFDELNFAACLNDSLYIQQTTGNQQKLIYASYDPQPKVFPSAVLIERGLQARRLSAAEQRLLEERFVVS